MGHTLIRKQHLLFLLHKAVLSAYWRPAYYSRHRTGHYADNRMSMTRLYRRADHCKARSTALFPAPHLAFQTRTARDQMVPKLRWLHSWGHIVR